MESVLSVKEMKEIESLTLKSLRITDIDLMHQAGQALAQDFLERVKPQKKDIITIVSSVGNNGGDGLVVYLELVKMGYKPKMIVMGHIDHASSAFKHYFKMVSRQTKVYFLSKETETQIHSIFLKTQYLIDALFGSGLKRPIEGLYLSSIDVINGLDLVVYSIDFPSGIHPENGLAHPKAIEATYTGVIGFYKYGNLLNQALDYHGEIKVLDIGLVKKHDTPVQLIDDDTFSVQPKKRTHHSYKYEYGFGYFIGGSPSMSGAINLSVLAAMKSGLGIAQVYQEKPQPVHLEVIYKDINQAIDLERPDVLVFGPGLETNNEHYLEIYQKINQTDLNSVIDGGGLSYTNIDEIKNPNMILTPHIKEFSDLFSVSIDEIYQEPFKYIKQLTEKHITLVLKGQTTIIADEKHIYLYQAKNPGLATAGSGDVLTGLIATYLIDNSKIGAAIKGVLLHSKAARYARETYGEISMMASDIVHHIHLVLKEETNEI